MYHQRNPYLSLNSSQCFEIDGGLALCQHMNITNGHREGVNLGLFHKGPRRGRVGDLSVAIRTVPPIRQMPNLTLDKNIPGVGQGNHFLDQLPIWVQFQMRTLHHDSVKSQVKSPCDLRKVVRLVEQKRHRHSRFPHG